MLNADSLFEVNVHGFARVPPRQTWRVLTDYERLTEFVPGLAVSKVLSRGEYEATVEQESRTGFLFLSHRVRLVLQIDERPYSAIDVALLAGDLKHYRAHWELEAAAQHGSNGTLITYSGTMTPKFYVPPLIAQPLLQANVQRMVEAVVAEIEKR